jgi:anti-sigma B factor antagonist
VAAASARTHAGRYHPAPMALDVTTDTQDDLTLVTLGGELDIYTVARFRQDLERFDPADAPLVIDLTEVTLLDSSGLGALVSLLNRARAGQGRLALICPHRRLRRVFEITGLRRAFVFGDDLESVRRALAQEPDPSPS